MPRPTGPRFVVGPLPLDQSLRLLARANKCEFISMRFKSLTPRVIIVLFAEGEFPGTKYWTMELRDAVFDDGTEDRLYELAEKMFAERAADKPSP